MGPKLKPTATVEGARIRLRLRQLKSNGFNQSSEKKSPGEVIEAGSALPKVSEKSSPALSNSRYGQTYSYVFATSAMDGSTVWGRIKKRRDRERDRKRRRERE